MFLLVPKYRKVTDAGWDIATVMHFDEKWKREKSYLFADYVVIVCSIMWVDEKALSLT